MIVLFSKVVIVVSLPRSMPCSWLDFHFLLLNRSYPVSELLVTMMVGVPAPCMLLVLVPGMLASLDGWLLPSFGSLCTM